MIASSPTLSRASSPMRGWVSLGELPARLGVSLWDVVRALESQGLADQGGRPTPQALGQEAARWMEPARQYHWRCECVAQALKTGARTSNNPTTNPSPSPHGYASMKEVGAPFQRAAVAVGQQLKRMGWRDSQGTPSAYALSKGLAHMQVSAHGRVHVRWHLARTRRALLDAGWEPVASPAPARRNLGRPAYLGKARPGF